MPSFSSGEVVSKRAGVHSRSSVCRPKGNLDVHEKVELVKSFSSFALIAEMFTQGEKVRSRARVVARRQRTRDIHEKAEFSQVISPINSLFFSFALLVERHLQGAKALSRARGLCVAKRTLDRAFAPCIVG